MSFRHAVKIEHPNGIPLAKNYEDYGSAYDGKMLLIYEPPVASLGTLSIGVFCRLTKTTVSFAGILESDAAGEPLAPSQELINSVREAVKQMAADIHETKNNIMSYVMEELLNYCVVNVPVKEVYESIRINYPKEYRTLNLDYKRRYNKTIDEDIDTLTSKQQQSHRYGKSKSWIKLALKKNDVVTLNDDKLEELKVKDAKHYQQIMEELKKIKSFNDRYIVYNDPQNKTVKLIGRDLKNPKNYVRTDISIPQDYLEIYQDPEEEDELGWMSPEDKKDFGVQEQAPQEQPEEYERVVDVVDLSHYNIPATVYTNDKILRKYSDKILEIYNYYQKTKTQIRDQKFNGLIPKLQQYKENKAVDNRNKNTTIVSQVKLDAFGIPANVYDDPSLAQQYSGKILQAYQWYVNNGNKIDDKRFTDLVATLLRSRKAQPQPKPQV